VRSRKKKFFKACSIIFLLNVFAFWGGNRVEAEERTRIGPVEEVILLPWGVRLPARIDTGAAQSSLDARELTIKDNMAEFKLPEKYGGLRLRLPILTRPVVEVELCVGPRHLRTRVNLNDRSKVKYPLIIGRNILRGNFVVDCMKSKCAPPSCPEAAAK